jgi:hydroxymethylpyrimidine/phosphomethylpyrimidine kinase
MRKPPVVWTIAGFDPSCGAGITADVKTIGSFGCYGVACITALTVQNTLQVRNVQPVAPEVVRETLESLLQDLPPEAIKIGMLATAAIAAVVADFLTALRPRCPIVLDPILRSSSGAELLEQAGVQVLLTRVLPLCTVATPNRAEAAVLTGVAAEDAEACGRALRRLGAAAVVVTGGDHFESEEYSATAATNEHTPGTHSQSEDVLVYGANETEFIETLSAPHIRSTSTHGTGCAFSTAIACGLAQEKSIPVAVTAAKQFVISAIERAPGLGHGHGPLALDRSTGQ